MKSVHFGFGLSFCAGTAPSVGLNSRGNVVVVHEAAGGEKRYHVGHLSQATIRWGTCKPAGSGETPRVALNNNDIAVEVHRNATHRTLYCRVGRIGSDDVTWPHARSYADGSNRSRPAVALNDAGVVVEEHEVHEGKKVWLYHAVGQVKESGRELYVEWFERIRGAEAAMPAITINNSGTVVEVHRYPYGSKDRRLFYTIGRVNAKKIDFEPRKEIVLPNGVNANGYYPSVAITDDGLVIVVLRDRTRVQVLELIGEAGADAKSITWKRWWYYDEGTQPSVAAAGTMAVEVHQHERHPELRFSTSIITDRASWMQDRLDTLGRKRLRELVLPASHDAGMYRGNIPGLARNQKLSIYEQLHYGVRYFELRPMWGVLGKGPWLIHHGGIPGPSLQTVLNDVKQFAAQGHRELVILKFSHFKYVDNDHYRRFVAQIENTIGDWLVKKNRIPQNKRLAEITLNEYVKPPLPPSSPGPAILVVIEMNLAIDYRRDGIWVYREWQEADNGDLCVFDRYSNTEDFAKMRKDQFVDKFADYDGMMKNGKLPCDLFLLSWTLTPQTVQEVAVAPIFPGLPFGNKSVRLEITPWLLARRSNPQLGHDIHLGGPKPALPPPDIPNGHDKIINLLFVDYVESSRVTDVALFLNGERATAADEAKPPRKAKAAALRRTK
ncbi:MAG TPA: hypothetical protein VGQ21_01860 [Thermoanaerobaculia bacterium]|jgi:hypothetical protein|nr:hypothetical protein [Thermoanaerobaculia bacterium]